MEQSKHTPSSDPLDRWRKLNPDATEEELRQADENMRRYSDVAWRVFLRLRREGRLDEVLGSHNPKHGNDIQGKLF